MIQISTNHEDWANRRFMSRPGGKEAISADYSRRVTRSRKFLVGLRKPRRGDLQPAAWMHAGSSDRRPTKEAACLTHPTYREESGLSDSRLTGPQVRASATLGGLERRYR